MNMLDAGLSAIAAQACAPWKRACYVEALANVNQQGKRIQPASADGPFVLTSLMFPGAATYPATGTISLSAGAKYYTDGPVRASSVGIVGAAGVTAAAALGCQYSWPAPIIIPAGGQLAAVIQLDAAATPGAGTFLRAFGFHTSEDFAAQLKAMGELYVAQLSLDEFTATVVTDKGVHEFPDNVDLVSLWHEQTPGTGGAITRLELRLDNEHMLRSPENGAGVLPPYPADPRSHVGIRALKGQQLHASATSDGGGTLSTHILAVGSRVY